MIALSSGLTLPSVRHRLPTFTATFASVLLATLMTGAFATLIETATGPVSDADRETLVIMGAVIGGWGALIALFSLVSTLGVAVRRRDAEIGLLRSIGATPRQARALIRRETLVLALVAGLAGAVLAWPTGRVLVVALRDAGMIDESVRAADGVAALSATLGAVLVVCLAAATIAGLRATRGTARSAMAEGTGRRTTLWRTVLGLVLVANAVGAGFVTVFVMADQDDPYAPMQTSGSASILAGVGLAVLAPTLLAAAARLLRPALALWGAPGHLAGFNADRRANLLAGVLGPVVVFTAAATGTLMLVGIDGRTLVLPPDMTRTEADTITLLNNLVVGMIALFAAIMVVNSLLAVVGDRTREFGRLRLVGATPEQVRRSVLLETAVVSVAGVVLGTLASLATVVPFAIARDEGPVPDGLLWLPGVVALTAVVLTIGTGQVAVRRALAAGGPVEAVSA